MLKQNEKTKNYVNNLLASLIKKLKKPLRTDSENSNTKLKLKEENVETLLPQLLKKTEGNLHNAFEEATTIYNKLTEIRNTDNTTNECI